MGAICSKPSNHTGGHTLISSSTTQTHSTSTTGKSKVQQQQQQQQQQEPHHQYQRSPLQGAETRRSQAAAAAERRLNAENKRGVNAANPNSGQLAARLEASKAVPLAPESRREDALILNPQWD
ncbi:hypothetical protein B0F90DRAFT_59271 [Multifurca ochricompacta]|uniref:Uncharacterized protein n=1 Tax=Multifurca ochricompacta TaxID=376703 RepID=A0AAD4QTT4_9AGAM|nr:hypothetical protein B0F90DRAFT_59271 [Multifurca ochricompacta]